MIELSTSVMSNRAKKINLFLIKKSETEKFLSKSLYNKKNIEIFKLSILERYLFKIGFLSSKYTNHIDSSDIIFIHNTKLFKYLKYYVLLKPIILFFHTDKKKKIYDIKKIKKVFTVNTRTKYIINKIYGNYKAVCLPNSIDIRNKKYLFKQINNKLVPDRRVSLVREQFPELESPTREAAPGRPDTVGIPFTDIQAPGPLTRQLTGATVRE